MRLGLLRHFGRLIVTLAAIAHVDAVAQSTGTVASPVVRPGASIGVAGAYALEDGHDAFAQRLDYRLAVSDSVRISALAFYNDRGGAPRYRRLALEVMHQVADDQAGWDSAIQVRAFIPDGNDGPARLRLAWLNRWRTMSGAELRLIGLVTEDFGRGRRDGLGFETRAEATWALAPGVRTGVQTFNRFSTNGTLASFHTQSHSVGGVLKGALTERASYRINALTGLSDAAADLEVRFRLSFAL